MRCRHLLVILLTAVVLLCSSAMAAAAYAGKATAAGKVYAKASASSSQVADYKKNDYVVIYGVKNGWAEVKVGNKTGYTKSSSVTKAERTAYVDAAYADVYTSAKTSSKKLSTLGYGVSVKLVATNDGWAQIKSGNNVGYCKASALGFTNPNSSSGKKVYPQSNSIKIYSYPSTSAGSKTIKYNTTLTLLCGYGDWYRVKNGSSAVYVKKSDVGTSKYDGYSTAKPANAKSVSVDWFKSSISSIFGRGTSVVVTDVKTGISWKVKRTGGIYHVDAEPLTKADTAAMKQACGSDYNTWDRRAIWVSIGNKKYAASMNCKPHGSSKITNNGFSGVFCIHFVNSKTHCSEKVDSSHQASIKAALKAG